MKVSTELIPASSLNLNEVTIDVRRLYKHYGKTIAIRGIDLQRTNSANGFSNRTQSEFRVESVNYPHERARKVEERKYRDFYHHQT